MANHNKIFFGLVLTAALVAHNTNATTSKFPRQPAAQARANWNAHRQASVQKHIVPTVKNDNEDMGRLLQNDEMSIINLKKGTPDDFKTYGDYKFDICTNKGSPFITKVTKKGIEVFWTEELHKKHQASLGQDLRAIIEDNMKD